MARRYVTIGKGPLVQGELNESPLMDNLPAAVMKLEWLARLTMPQLETLADGLDPRKASRKEVIAEVKSILGDKPAPPRKPDLEKQLDKILQRLTSFVQGIPAEEPDAGERHRLHCKVTQALEEIASANVSPAETPSCDGGENHVR